MQHLANPFGRRPTVVRELLPQSERTKFVPEPRYRLKPMHNIYDLETRLPAGYPTLHAISLLYQSNLGKLGHKVTVSDLELSAWIDRIATKPNFDITTDVYEMRGPDPTGMFNSDNLAPKGNINQFNPPGYAAMVTAAATETNPAKRIARYRQLQRYLLDEMPMVPICHTPILIGASKTLSGFSPGSTGLYEYAPATLT